MQTAVLNTQDDFLDIKAVLNFLQKCTIELITKLKEQLKTKQYNTLCIKLDYEMQNLADVLCEIDTPIIEKELRDCLVFFKKELEKFNLSMLKQIKKTDNKSKKYDEKLFYSSLALLEILNFSLNDELMRFSGGYQKQKDLSKFGKQIHNAKY
ncbi:hypothetical protein DMB95_00705 [Campylobacter sp. MIT 12-8780]|uniref:hypothetical protein n=1 Tax=unclassified Campylobacter TaxID=2593542 RepID=UPI00115DFAD5|nr:MULTISPECIES: hypothetical protein [unclassified Campylobacter]NDJ26480.1 hypothetical protein [Campylobacter sp. MIT 19-121]TQR43051.1 hypothetical protein DMB95_00705 [Campylobacter sp. MIT 12-8780]